MKNIGRLLGLGIAAVIAVSVTHIALLVRISLLVSVALLIKISLLIPIVLLVGIPLLIPIALLVRVTLLIPVVLLIVELIIQFFLLYLPKTS